MSTDTCYAVVMFAYNEADHIATSVSSVFANTDEQLTTLYVIANGCRDQTVPILKQLQQRYRKLQVIELAVGDKCNAWNHYVHQVAELAVPTHFFVDADVYFSEQVFPQLAQTLQASATAHAVAGLPLSGRNAAMYRQFVTERECFFGNCYGLKNRFIELARAKSFTLPIGLCWIDSAITKAVNTDLIDQKIGIAGRVTYKEGCGYLFRSLNPLKWRDIQLYLSRIARYEVGKLQEKYLDQLDFSQWPKSLAAINQAVLEKIEQGEWQVTWYLKGRILKRLKKPL